ncbi:uncharacterized protein LOC107645785 [Arachis ipaensis]|uniref:uncharacterized protein LOC107645785 n=1 Tax=Arachis ipaensis TaxID=130454 RepID=UPI0007AF96CA|nr:uncharacterized protein LOC107645785 [Arachis ipaensis]
MDSYRETYQHHINPIPGQTFWEVSESLKPQPPKIKRGPATVGKKDTQRGVVKRKKLADAAAKAKAAAAAQAKAAAKNTARAETNVVEDGLNAAQNLLSPNLQRLRGGQDTQRGVVKRKKLADAAAKAKAAAAAQAKAAAAAQAKAAAKNTTRAETNVVEDGQNAAKPDPNAEPDPNATDDANVGKDALADDDDTNVQPVEIELSQPIYSELEESQQAAEHLLMAL